MGYFQPYGVVDVFLFLKGIFLILYRTLGAPRIQMLDKLIQNAILWYLSQHHVTIKIMSFSMFRDKFWRSNAN